MAPTQLNPFAPEWKPQPALQSVARVQASAEARGSGVDKWAETTAVFDLAGLPGEVISSVCSFLDAPSDLANCMSACKLLKQHVGEAELCLQLRGSAAGASGAEQATYCSQALQGLRKSMAGTVSLSLPSVSTEDDAVRDLLAALPRLQLLDAPGGRKLTLASVQAIAEANAAAAAAAGRLSACSSARATSDGDGSGIGGAAADGVAAAAPPPPCRRASLRVLNLQRCFQLHTSSLEALLAAPGLGCLALSHLDLGRWPAEEGPAVGLRAHGLQALALHNCLRLHGPALAALAAAIGGSSPAGAGPRGARFLLLGGSTLAWATFVSGGSGSTPPPLPPRASELLAAAYKPAPSSAAATMQAHLAAAGHLLAAVLAMPALVALELTFFPPPLVHCLRCVLADEKAIGRSPVEVWDLATDLAGLQAARRTLRRALRVARPQPGTGGPCCSRLSSRGGEALDAQAAAMLLRCAVNCSSTARSTPLHLAAERGNVGGAAELLAAGAVVDARDTGGSTPLFLAAEAGHAGVLEALLGAGADPRQGNATGETPLYIAALRGHLGCVRALLAHCEARGLDWQDPELYGDAWTPLHAAAVADRADVAACLLQAAGSSGAGELVGAPNKYGQSVLHVAARKGSSQLLRLLLSAAAGGGGGAAAEGSRLLGCRDGSGDTPVDVAKKNRHTAALAEFRRLMVGGRGGGARQRPAATAMA